MCECFAASPNVSYNTMRSKLEGLEPGQTLDVPGLAMSDVNNIMETFSDNYAIRGPIKDGDNGYAVNMQVRGALQNA